MKFTRMDPIDQHPAIEIVSDGKLWDLHNDADFLGHKYDDEAKHLILMWVYGCIDHDIPFGQIFIDLKEVMELHITDKDLEVPRLEDDCLEQMCLIDINKIQFTFRGGQIFTVTCQEVAFNSNGTIGHQAYGNRAADNRQTWK